MAKCLDGYRYLNDNEIVLFTDFYYCEQCEGPQPKEINHLSNSAIGRMAIDGKFSNSPKSGYVRKI